VLVRGGAGSFTIVSILDAEPDPARAYAVASDRLMVMALRCAGYTSGGEGRVSVHLVEVRDAIRPEDQRRLERLCQDSQRTALAAADVRASLLAPRTGEVWSTLGWMEARWYKQALTAPRREAEDLVPRSPTIAPRHPSTAPPALATRAASPWLTGGIIALTVAIFAVEGLAGVGNSPEPRSPTVDTLVALGGVSRELVVTQGQWWRLFTATLLHGGVAHLLLNGACLFFGGVVLETLFGRAWLGAIFILGALGGSLASITLNDPGMVSVGASGAIMGLLAAALVATFRLPPAQRPQLQWTMGRLLVPSLLPIATSRGGQPWFPPGRDTHRPRLAQQAALAAAALCTVILPSSWRVVASLGGPRRQVLGWAHADRACRAAGRREEHVCAGARPRARRACALGRSDRGCALPLRRRSRAADRTRGVRRRRRARRTAARGRPHGHHRRGELRRAWPADVARSRGPAKGPPPLDRGRLL
jgi:rhomboid protease GluP